MSKLSLEEDFAFWLLQVCNLQRILSDSDDEICWLYVKTSGPGLEPPSQQESLGFQMRILEAFLTQVVIRR